MRMIRLNCDHFTDAGVWDEWRCCGGCHDEDDSGYDTMVESTPPAALNGHTNHVEAHVCCTGHEHTSRSDFARALLTYRSNML